MCNGEDADDDDDGMPDVFEELYGCLNPLQPDATLDPDGDALTNGQEFSIGTDPCSRDTDGDGCGDGRESLVQDAVLGGLRDPLNPWDYMNPTHDRQNRVDDILLVVAQYHKDQGNPNYTQDTDRTLLGPNAWNLGPPNGQQRVDDILNSMYQYHHDCR